MNKSEVPPVEAQTFLHRSERGELRIWLAAPTVLVFKYKGHSDSDYVRFIGEVFEKTLANKQQPTHVFVDCEEQTGFDQGFRRDIAKWSAGVAPTTETYCILVRSRVVALGIALSQVAVGKVARHVQVMADRATFRNKLELAVQRSLTDCAVAS